LGCGGFNCLADDTSRKRNAPAQAHCLSEQHEPKTLADADLLSLGKRIRDCRAIRGLTQGAVAGTDMSVAYLSRIEAGQRRPHMRILELIARRLDMTVEELLGAPKTNEFDPTEVELCFAEVALASGQAEEAAGQLTALLDGSSLTSRSMQVGAL
jgi:transcriptional regulator with XRE-family HTH domain